jgi:hypothetical protein
MMIVVDYVVEIALLLRRMPALQLPGDPHTSLRIDMLRTQYLFSLRRIMPVLTIPSYALFVVVDDV